MRTAIIAGSGLLPVEAAKALTCKGEKPVIITFSEQGADDLSAYSDEIEVFGLGQVGKILKFLKKSSVESLVFAGSIDKSILERKLKLDLKAIFMLARLKDRLADTIMLAIAGEIEKCGIKILSQTDVLSDLVIRHGVYTKRKVSAKEMKDVGFAFEKAKALAGLDIGQSIVVKNRSVLAVESIEGTNNTISRGAQYCDRGFVFMKVAKPNQDFRFDIPVIGMETLEVFAEKKGEVFAIEADKSLVIDIDKCIDFADSSGFAFMAYSENSDD